MRTKRILAWVAGLAAASGAAGADIDIYEPSTLDLRPDNAIPADWTPSSNVIRVCAAPGRIADLALAVTGRQRPLADVTLQVPPLAGPDGSDAHLIPVPEERIRAVVCSYRPKGGLSGPADWKAPGSYDYMPYALMYDAGLIQVNHGKRRATVRTGIEGPDFLDDRPPLKPRAIPANEMRQWQVMVPVPENGTPPGVYRGSARILSAGRLLAAVPLELTVLPFKPLPPAKLYGIYENLTLSGMAVSDPRYRLMIEDFVETGIHNPWLCAAAPVIRTADGRQHVSFEDLERAQAIRAAAGLDPDVSVLCWGGTGYNFYNGGKPEPYTEAARKLKAWWDLRGFKGEVAVYGKDESSGAELREVAALYRAAATGGVPVATACSGGYFAEAGGAIKYPIIAGGMRPDDNTVADVAAARAAGAVVLNYDQPQLIYHDPLLYRVRAGFNLWTNVYDGWFPFTYAWGFHEDHRQLRAITQGGGAPYKTHGVVLVGKDRLIPQVEWPAVRQGIDDVRYATTLAAQVLKAREANRAPELAAEAERFLRDPAVQADDWGSVEAARAKTIDLILRLEKAHPDLRVATLHREAKAQAAKVNRWILPDLSFRPFPMGLPELETKVRALEAQAKDKPLEAMFAGLAAKELVREARAAGKLNPVEGVMAMGRFGNLVLDAEEACLSLTPPKEGGPAPLERHFTVLRVANEGWVFQPDRDNAGLAGNWFAPDHPRTGWSPIDVTRVWQQQGRPEWQDLEGSRVGMEGIGWYALTLDVPAQWAGKKLFLWFVSDEDARVWLNGKEVRSRNEGPMIRRWVVPALAPLEGVKAGPNTVVIRVCNSAMAGGLWNGIRIVERK